MCPDLLDPTHSVRLRWMQRLVDRERLMGTDAHHKLLK